MKLWRSVSKYKARVTPSNSQCRELRPRGPHQVASQAKCLWELTEYSALSSNIAERACLQHARSLPYARYFGACSLHASPCASVDMHTLVEPEPRGNLGVRQVTTVSNISRSSADDFGVISESMRHLLLSSPSNVSYNSGISCAVVLMALSTRTIIDEL